MIDFKDNLRPISRILKSFYFFLILMFKVSSEEFYDVFQNIDLIFDLSRGFDQVIQIQQFWIPYFLKELFKFSRNPFKSHTICGLKPFKTF
jgi:hypothetical protein